MLSSGARACTKYARLGGVVPRFPEPTVRTVCCGDTSATPSDTTPESPAGITRLSAIRKVTVPDCTVSASVTVSTRNGSVKYGCIEA